MIYDVNNNDNYHNNKIIAYDDYTLGLSICGSGLGTFIFAPLTQK